MIPARLPWAAMAPGTFQWTFLPGNDFSGYNILNERRSTWRSQLEFTRCDLISFRSDNGWSRVTSLVLSFERLPQNLKPNSFFTDSQSVPGLPRFLFLALAKSYRSSRSSRVSRSCRRTALACE